MANLKFFRSATASASAKGLAEASDVKNYVDNHVSTTLAWASFE